MVDVTEEWMESMRCIDNVQFDFQGCNYIHPESDIPFYRNSHLQELQVHY